MAATSSNKSVLAQLYLRHVKKQGTRNYDAVEEIYVPSLNLAVNREDGRLNAFYVSSEKSELLYNPKPAHVAAAQGPQDHQGPHGLLQSPPAPRPTLLRTLVLRPEYVERLRDIAELSAKHTAALTEFHSLWNYALDADDALGAPANVEASGPREPARPRSDRFFAPRAREFSRAREGEDTFDAAQHLSAAHGAGAAAFAGFDLPQKRVRVGASAASASAADNQFYV